MYDAFLAAAIWFFPALLTGIVFAPVGAFLKSGWVARRDDVLGTFVPKAIGLYLNVFAPSSELDESDSSGSLERRYGRRFGRQHYIVPSILLALTAMALLYMATVTAISWLTGETTGAELPPIAVTAIAGAYMWVVCDINTRSRAGDLWPPDLTMAALRLAVAIPVGFAFSAFVKEPVALPMAFMVGAFPTRTLITVSRRIATRRLSLGEDAESGRSELEALQGINAGVAERLAAENTTTMVQLAYADPIDLTMRTGYSFTFIVDCVSQALAWLYLEDRLANVRIYGMRGAQEIANLIDELDEQTGEESVGRGATIAAVAGQLGLDANSLELTLREIHGDPYTQFLQNIWQQATG